MSGSRVYNDNNIIIYYKFCDSIEHGDTHNMLDDHNNNNMYIL